MKDWKCESRMSEASGRARHPVVSTGHCYFGNLRQSLILIPSMGHGITKTACSIPRTTREHGQEFAHGVVAVAECWAKA